MRPLALTSLKFAIPTLVGLTAILASAASAQAASLVKVNQSDWQAGVSGLPSYVNMYIYVPGQLATKPPIVVAPHHCQGTASSTYSEMSSLVSIADKSGFIMVIPEATGQNCWDAGSDRSLSHSGKGDTGAIVQMVKYTIGKYSADAKRVYSVGGSSGGIMTEALLGVYPDVFMAGVSIMGVPCGCWAQEYGDFTGTASMGGKTPQWSAPCAGGNVTKTAQAWGDLVRSYYPGYTGHRPRLQHWHGTDDETLNYKNVAEDVKEWTNVLGLSATPTGSDMPKSGTTRQFWKNSCGFTVFETFSLAGVKHTVGFDGNAVAAYFGLDKANSPDPEAAACDGMGGTGGAGAGGNGAGGASAGQNAGGSAGRAAGGASNGNGGSSTASGGASQGGAVNSGGSGPGAGGAIAAAGSGTGGSATGAGGSSTGSGGSANGSGGAQASGGALASSGGKSTSGGAAASSGGSAGASGGDSNGCSCTVVGSSNRSVATMGIGAFALALVGMRRRRSGRAR